MLSLGNQNKVLSMTAHSLFRKDTHAHTHTHTHGREHIYSMVKTFSNPSL